MVKTVGERLIRSSLALIVSQLIPMIPGLIGFIPAPYNLVVIPVLMGIAKGLRDGFPQAPWLKYIPF